MRPIRRGHISTYSTQLFSSLNFATVEVLSEMFNHPGSGWGCIFSLEKNELNSETLSDWKECFSLDFSPSVAVYQSLIWSFSSISSCLELTPSRFNLKRTVSGGSV